MKLGSIETASVRGTRVAMAASLVALLLITQFPLASANFTSSFTLETNSNLLDAEEPETDIAGLVFPDLLHAPAIRPQQNLQYGAEFSPIYAGREVHVAFPNIRAPPRNA